MNHHNNFISKKKKKKKKETKEKGKFNLKKYILCYKVLSKWNLSILNGIVTGSTAFICGGGIIFGCAVSNDWMYIIGIFSINNKSITRI